MNPIHTYSGFTLNAIKEMYAYRVRMLIWIVYDFIILFVQYYLWRAIFASSGGSLLEIGLDQYLAYVGFGLIFSRLIMADVDGFVAQEIKSGNIAMHLIKPYSFFGMVSAGRIGMTLGGFIALIPVSVTILFLIEIPALTLFTVLATIVSMFLSYILITVFFFLLGLLAFWMTNYWGLFLFKENIIALFSGQIIALNLLFQIGRSGLPNFPIPMLSGEFVRNFFLGLGWLSYMLPFQAMSYTPTGIFTGMIVGRDMVLAHLALQLFWVFVVSGITWFAWKRAQLRITIRGG
ncbi:ABC-2 family transporter protein [Spirochaeta dissipatitropha]